MTIYNGTSGNDTLVGSTGDDEIYGLAGDDNLDGDAGNDQLFGEDGDDTINGGDGNDILVGGAGVDTLDGGAGDDMLSGGTSGSNAYGSVYLRAGINTLYAIQAYYNTDIATGETIDINSVEGIEKITTEEQVIANVAAADAIASITDTGADIIDGGDGIDTVFYNDSTEGIKAYLNGTAGTGGTSAGDTLFNIENLVGSDYNDTLYGDAFDNIFNGGAGNDSIYVYDGDDIANGGAGNDTFYASSGADTFNGGDGSDMIYYRNSPSAITISLLDNTASGGWAEGDNITGIERIYSSNYSDTIIGNEANNNIEDRGGNDTFYLGGGNDYVIDYGGNDIIYGGAGSDLLILKGAGNNEVYGGEGNDWIFSTAGADILDGGDGDFDAVEYAWNAPSVTISLMDNTASGGWAEGDTISGFENIYATNGADILIGDDKDNVFIGRHGADIMTGNGGNDMFYYENWAGVSNSTPTAYDTITDFVQGEDVLLLSSSQFPEDLTLFSWDNSSGTETILTHETLTDFEVHFTGVYDFTENDFDFAYGLGADGPVYA